MRLRRRAILAFGAVAAMAPAALAQTPAPAPLPDPAIAIAAKATEARLKLDFDGQRFSGPAYDLLLNEAKQAQFFLIGEEHGIAENPKLAGQLFETAGYRRLGIEVSHPIAQELDAAARGGVAGLQRMFQVPGSTPAFFGMKEEAEMLARVRAAVPSSDPAF